jgi:hypothetical protein
MSKVHRLFAGFIVLVGGCSSLPTGTFQIAPAIEADAKQARGRKDSGLELNAGRPIFLEVHAYPRLLASGDLVGDSRLFLYLTRESLSLDGLLVSPRDAEKGGRR